MAEKLGLAAKLFLATTTLAAGGAGTYYGMTAVWPELTGAAASGAASLQADAAPQASETAFAAGDLDAVASAWAEPLATAQPTARVDASETARSAEKAPTAASSAAASSLAASPRAVSADQPADRYAFEPQVEPITNAPEEPADETPQPTPAAEADFAPLVIASEATEGTASDVAGDPVAAPAADEPSASPALARGQEPEDELFADEAAEPQPLNVSGQEQGIQAIDGQADAAAVEQPSGAARDRYGRANTSPVGPATVNPFSSRSPSNTESEATPESLQALPELPHRIGDRQEPQQHELASPTGDSSRAPRAAVASPPNAFSAEQPSRPDDDSLFAEPSTAPSAGAGVPAAAMGQSAAEEGTGRPGERALEGLQRPAIEIQKFAPGEIQVGKPAKFVVQIRNVSSHAAENVRIRDEVPQGTRLISTAPSAETVGSQLTWDIGNLSPGEDRTVEMQVMPVAEGEVGSVATVSYSAQASVKTRCTMPQLAIRMTAPEKVMIGQEQRVKIELRNPGSGDATGVMLFENVPENVRHAAGPTLEFEVGTLAAGETRELELVLMAEKAGKTVNVLTARADGNLQVQQQVEFEVVAPGLMVDLIGPDRRYLERPATYEVSVENPGTAPAHDVQIVTKLPKGMRFVRANNLGEYDSASHAVYWSLAELPEGERGTVELVAMPTETGTQALEVESRTVEGLSDRVRREIEVEGLAAIMFELRDMEDPIEVGRETGYEIRVVNQGTKAATNVAVAVSLSPGMKFVSAEGETRHSASRQGIIFEPIPQLAPKADSIYRIRVQGTQAGDQRVAVEVDTDDIGQPIRREESTRVFGDE